MSDQVVGRLSRAGVAGGNLRGMGHDHRLAAGRGFGRELAKPCHLGGIDSPLGGISEVAGIKRVGQDQAVDPREVFRGSPVVDLLPTRP